MKYSPGFIQETLKIIINNLNDDREYLGLQLALAQGIISKKLALYIWLGTNSLIMI
jgi:hypothetical protein